MGRDEAYNIVVGGNFNINGDSAEAEGRIYVGGTINHNSARLYNLVAVGSGACVVPQDSNVSGNPGLIVGGNLNNVAGSTLALDGLGMVIDAQVGGVKTGAGIVTSLGVTTYGAAIPASPVNFTTLRSNSVLWGTLPSTGSFVNQFSALTFTGDGTSALQVFNYNGGSISGTTIDFESIPVGATVIINVINAGTITLDTPDFLVNGSNGFNSGFTRRTVWNFINAGQVNITGNAQFLGSVIVPNGSLLHGVPGLNGRVIVSGDLSQNGTANEFHNYEFIGNLPDAASLVFTKAYSNNTPNRVTAQPSITMRAVCSTSGTKNVTFTPPATGTINGLFSGESCTLSETAITGGTLSGGYTFSAVGSATFSGANPRTLGAGNNAVTVTNPLVGPTIGDISVKKTLDTVNGAAPGATVKAGDVLRYKLALLENTGSGSASVTLSEAVPANTSYTGGAEGWSCAAGTCTQTVPMTGGASTNVFFTVTVATPIPDGVTQIANTVALTPVTGTSSCLGGATGCQANIPTAPKLSILKAISAANLSAGGTGTYTLTVSNAGGTTSSGTVTFVDTLPVGLTFASQGAGTLAGMGCSAVGQTVTCTGTPNLAAGASGTVLYTVNVAVTASGTLTNDVRFNAGTIGGDPRTPSCNATAPAAGASTQSTDKLCSKASATITVGTLTTTKALFQVNTGSGFVATPVGYHAKSGDVLKYRISVTETGGSAAAVTTLTETVPTTTSYSGGGEGWSAGCVGAGTSCTQAVTVAAGATVTKDFTVTVATLADGITTITNTVGSSNGLCTSCSVPTPTVPKLNLIKSGGSSIAAGGSGSYTLQLSNVGGSATSGTVTLSDVLPASLSFAGQTSGVLSCSAAGQTVTCTGTPNLAAGASLSVVYTVNASVGATGTLTNSAQVTVRGGDPRTPSCDNNGTPTGNSGNQSTDKLCTKWSLDVVVGNPQTSKALTSVVRAGTTLSGSSLPAKVQANDVLTYTITVQNTAAGVANTTLTETVPANTSYSGSGQGWSAGCVGAGTTCTQAVSVPGNSTTTKLFTVTIAAVIPDGVTSIANSVAASLGACSACTVTTPTPPKLAVAKTISAATLNAGGTGTYTLTISNVGGSSSSGTVTLTDVLPTGLTYASQGVGTLAGMACSAAGQTVTCTGSPTLAVGASATVLYTVNVGVSATGTLTNDVRFTTGAIGGDPRTPSCNATIPAAGASSQSTDKLCSKASATITAGSLSTAKTLTAVNGGAVPGGYQAHAGDVLQYTVTTTATTGAASMSLCETVPANTSYSGSGEGWNAGVGACSVGTTHNQVVTVSPGTPVSKTYTVTIVNPIPDNVSAIANTVVVTTGTCASCTVTTPTQPKLSILKTVSAASLNAGGTGTYTLTVSNLGGSTTAGTVTLTDTLPTGLTYAAQGAGTLAGMACSAAGQAVTCTGSPTLAAGASANVIYTVNVAVSATGTLTNDVRFGPGTIGGDPRTPSCNAANPAAGASSQSTDKLCSKSSTTVTAGTLAVTKALFQVNTGSGFVATPVGYQAKSGDLLKYRISVQEFGGNASASTTLIETVPTTTSYSGVAEGWTASCTTAGTTCTQAVTVAAGATVTRDYTVTVATLPDNVTTITNTVATSTGVCPSCSVLTPTVPKLNLIKSGGSSIAAGGSGSYTLQLSNVGGSATNGVVTISDVLPASLTFASQTSGVLSCSAAGQTVSCTGTPNLAAGGSLSIVYTVNASAGAIGTLTNSAQVTVRGGDPRTPSCDNAGTPAANAGNQSTDKLCTKWSLAVVLGNPQTSKALTSVVRAGVTLTGSSLPASVQGGDVLTYTISVQNTTAGIANTTLTETVPTTTSYTGAAEGWTASCTTAGTTCTQAVSVAGNSTVTKQFTVTIAAVIPDNVTTVANSVTTSLGVCSDCTVSKPTPPKLKIAKTGPPSIPAGGVGDYTVTLTNVGGSSTSGVLDFTDTLPTGQTFVLQSEVTTLVCDNDPTLTIGTCSGTPNLAPGQNLTVTYKATVATNASGNLTNVVRPTVPLRLAGDPRTPNCDNAATPAAGAGNVSTDGLCAKWTVSVTAGTLATAKTLSAVNGGAVPGGYKAQPGDVLQYTVTTTATTGAASTSVCETVPANTAYSGTGEGWSAGAGACTAGTTHNQVITVSPGTPVSKTYTVTIASPIPDNVTSIANTVTVTNGTCATCSVTTPTQPKLAVRKTISAVTLNAGGTGVYTLTISNLGGTSTSGAITLVDTLPTGLTYASQGAGTLAGMACSAVGQTVTCTGSPTLAAGASSTVLYTVNVAVTATGTLTNDVRFTTGSIGGDPRTPVCNAAAPTAGASSQSSDKLCSKASATIINGQILVRKNLFEVDTGGGFVAVPVGYTAKTGDKLKYRIRVIEFGGNASASTVLTETVPNASSYSGVAEGWSAGCVAAGSSCTQAVTVAAGQTEAREFTVTVGALADNVTSVTNTVAVPPPALCAACNVLTPTDPKLNLIKSGGSSIAAGGSGNYTLLLSNVGGSATRGVVTLTDTLPATLSFGSQVSGVLACSAAGQTVTCTGTPNLAAGGSLNVVYSVNASALAAGTLTNSAVVSTRGGDSRTPNCDNNGNPAANAGNQSSDKLCTKWSLTVAQGNPQTSKALTSVVRNGVTLSGSSLPQSVQANDQLNYTITVQNTAAGVANTVLTETVPNITSYSGSAQGWSAGCTAAGTNCTQTVSVAGNTTATRQFTVTVAAVIPDGVTQLTNTVASSDGLCSACVVTTPTVPKLRITKTGPATIPAGGVGDYVVTLFNVGGSSTSGKVDFTDVLPAGQTFVDQSEVTTMTCPANPELTIGNCTGTPNLAPGQSMTLTYKANVAVTATGNLTNTISPTSPLALAGDPRAPVCDNGNPAAGSGNGSGDGLCAKWTVAVAIGSLSTVKSLSAVNGQLVPADYKALPGDVLQYTITTTASTASASTSLCETTPANTSYTGNGEGWTVGTGACPAGTTHNQVINVAPGTPVSKIYTVTLANPLPSSVTQVSNVVRVTNGNCPGCTVNTPVNGFKALDTVKTLSSVTRNGSKLEGTSLPSLLMPGDLAAYRLTTTELLGQTSATTVLTETVPQGTTFAGSAALWPGCTAAGSSCTSSVTLGAKQSSSIEFVVLVDKPLASNITQIANNITSSDGLCSSCGVITPIGASLSGTVWIDVNHDRKRDAGEPLVAGVLVQLLDNAAQPVPSVAPVRTDANGFYSFGSVQPGVTYRVQFRAADGGLIYGMPTYDENVANTPAGASATLTSGVSTIASDRSYLTVVLNPGGNMIHQSLPLDPSGVVYNSVTRTPIGGAVVTLTGPVGFLPQTHLVGGQSAVQQTTSLSGGIPGGYQFLLLPSAPSGRYCLDVTASGYAKSATILPTAESLQVPAGGGILSINKDNLLGVPPPQAGQDTTYYFCFVLDPATAPQLIHNHMPMDTATTAALVVSKVVDRAQAGIGDLVRYTVRISVVDNAPAQTLSMQDRMARGFSVIPGTWVVEKTGGAAVSARRVTDPTPLPAIAGDGAGWKLDIPVAFLPLIKGQQVLVSYRVRVGVGAQVGDGINRVRAFAGTSQSNEAIATVTVSGGVFDNAACVAGKVFVDCNGNHVQDAKELGIPGVRLYLEDGTFMITDSEGKYSYCGLRAIDHVIKLDPITLPPKARITTSSNRNLGDADSQVIEARAGLLQRADFIEGSCSPIVVDDVMRRRARGEASGAETRSKDATVTSPPMIRFEGRPANKSRSAGAQQ